MESRNIARRWVGAEIRGDSVGRSSCTYSLRKKNGYIYILLQIQGNQNAGAAREEFGTPALAPVELL